MMSDDLHHNTNLATADHAFNRSTAAMLHSLPSRPSNSQLRALGYPQALVTAAHDGMDLGMHYDEHSYPSMSHHAGTTEFKAEDGGAGNNTQDASSISPVSPSASDEQTSPGIAPLSRSRSGSSRTENSHRVKKPIRARKNRGVKDENKTPALNGPLSELTQDMSIPVRDMEAWVNRSAEVRQEEARKENGYVRRPMNSFMLYRSAYADRTKEWCRQNNHQVVSSVSGKSWPLEPPEVKKRFEEYARMERQNHQQAHPNYKFSPLKNGSKKRKTAQSEGEDEMEDMSADEDDEWRPSNKLRPTQRQADMFNEVARSDYLASSSQYHFGGVGQPEQHLQNPYWSPQEVKHAPQLAYDMYGHVIQPSNIQTHFEPNALVGHEYRIDSPHLRYDDSHMMMSLSTDGSLASHGYSTGSAGLLGLPGVRHNDLVGSQTSTPTVEHQVDPMLLGAHNAGHHMTHVQMFGGAGHLGSNYGDYHYGGEAENAGDAWQTLGPAYGQLETGTDFDDKFPST